MFAVRAALVCAPDAFFEPDHPPDAAQLVALVVDHVSRVVAPDASVAGDAVNVSVGAGAVPFVTATVSVASLTPAAPAEHVSLYVLLAASAPVECDPANALVPVQAPFARQLVARVTVHDNVELLPDATVVGDAANAMIGAGVTVTVLDTFVVPPVPLQLSEYVLAVVMGPTVCDPDLAFVPVHAPLAVQLDALVDDHVSENVASEKTAERDDERVTVGAAAAASSAAKSEKKKSTNPICAPRGARLENDMMNDPGQPTPGGWRGWQAAATQ